MRLPLSRREWNERRAARLRVKIQQTKDKIAMLEAVLDDLDHVYIVARSDPEVRPWEATAHLRQNLAKANERLALLEWQEKGGKGKPPGDGGNLPGPFKFA